MSSIVVAGDVSGAVSIVAPSVAGSTVLTLPSVSGTVLASGTAVTVAQGGTGIQPVTATVASSALTVGINATSLQFRSATLTTGVPTTALAVGALSLVVPSTATLGTVSAVQSQLVLVVLYNGGTPALGIVNISGGTNLDETTLLSTTAMTTGATSASVVYSASAITSSPFRVVGTVVSTQATAGTWATTPSLVQGQGGQAMASMQSLGFGQTWTNVKTSPGRVLGTTYTNSTGRPIMVSFDISSSSGSYTTNVTVNGLVITQLGAVSNIGAYFSSTFIVPAGNTYVVSNTGGALDNWTELR